VDVSAPLTRTDVANCDMLCELQDSVSHCISECTLRPSLMDRAYLFELHFITNNGLKLSMITP